MEILPTGIRPTFCFTRSGQNYAVCSLPSRAVSIIKRAACGKVFGW